MREIISTPNAPEAVGSYSQAIRVGNMLLTAGQIALVPHSERPTLDNADITTETRRIMGNLSAILTAGGCTFNDVVRSRIYIADMTIFQEVNEEYAKYFEAGNEPVRECVVAQPPLEGANVEISMDAYRQSWHMPFTDMCH